MKKILNLILIFFFLSNTLANASTMYCKVDKAYKCEEGGCNEFKSEIFINIDTNRNTYQRGDTKGLDTYNMNIFKSGNFIIAEVEGSATLKIDTINNMRFVEIVHLGLSSYNNFGMCKLN